MGRRALVQFSFQLSCVLATSSMAGAGDGALFPVRQFPWPAPTSWLDLAAADLDADGDVDVAATTGSQLLLYRNDGRGVFELTSTNATGADTVSLTLADLDADGDLDAITAHQSASSIAWFPNLGGGAFGPANTISTASAPLEVAAGDLDGDGDLDLAVAVQGTNAVTLFLNDGGGSFAHHADVPAHVGPRTLAIADLDGDGDRDIALGASGQGSVSVLSNLGGGSFAQTFIEYQYSTSPTDVWAGDLDGDGDVDLAFARSATNTVALMRNQGNGTFVTQTIDVGGRSHAVAARDLDGDGDVDLVFAVEAFPVNPQADHVVVLENAGGSSFAAPRTIWTNGGCRAIALGDTDNDDFVDALAGFSEGFDVAPGLPGASFAANLVPVTGQSTLSYQPVLRDLDGDTDLDLLSVGGTSSALVHVWRNDGSDGLTGPTITTVPAGSFCCYGSHYGDLEPDGDLDVVIQTSVQSFVTAINDGSGNYAPGPTTTPTVRVSAGQLADVDGDLDLDYLVASDLPPYDSGVLTDHLSLYRNVGGASFQEVSHTPMGRFGFPLVLDADGDGDPDVVFVGKVSFSDPIEMRVLLNDGTGVFTGTWTAPWPSIQYFTATILVDVDGDLDLDIVVSVPVGSTLGVIENLGNGTFASPTLHAAAGEIASLSPSDVDHDGDQDVLATLRSHRLVVHFNDGTGAFSESEAYAAAWQNGFGTNLTSGDLDRDGAEDVIIATFSGLVRIDGQHGGEAGVPFCSGDGSASACPCGNSGPAGAGCAHSFGGAGTLGAGGRASVSDDTLTLCASGLPPTSSCLYFQGTTRVNGGLGATFGDGLRCAGGSIVRLGQHASAGGFSQLPSSGDLPISIRGGVVPPVTLHYQTWYRNAASFCTPFAFNLTNGLSVAWVP